MRNIYCIDTRISKRKVLSICKSLNIIYEKTKYTNINGGKYIKVYNDNITAELDIYYKSIMNSILYPDSPRSTEEELLEKLKEFKSYEEV